MKAFFALPALFAAAAYAAPEPSWAFTFTFSDAHSTWESATVATAAPNATTTEAPKPAWTGPSEWVSTTSYTAVFSSGTSTWGVPTVVSYSCGESWTSMIPAPSTASTPAPSSTWASTTAAPVSPPPSTTAAAAVTSYTGAAVPNVNGKLAGVGAMAMAGLALVL